MDTNQLNRLTELKFLSGELESMDEFSALYETMLTDCKAIEDKQERQAGAKQMQRILLKQAEYLLNKWLKEKQKVRPVLNYGSIN